jgi:hypothetical protein
MNLTDSELRVIRKWQKYQRWWPRTRWLCLLGSLAGIAAFAIILRWLAFLPADSSQDAAAVGWLSPIAWILLFMSSGWLGLTIAHWSGDVKTRLLLKLVEEHEKPQS